jgi:hypothetical protein
MLALGSRRVAASFSMRLQQRAASAADAENAGGRLLFKAMQEFTQTAIKWITRQTNLSIVIPSLHRCVYQVANEYRSL